MLCRTNRRNATPFLSARVPFDITLNHFTQCYTVCAYAVLFDINLSHFTVCMCAVLFDIALSYLTQRYTVCLYTVPFDITLSHLTLCICWYIWHPCIFGGDRPPLPIEIWSFQTSIRLLVVLSVHRPRALCLFPTCRYNNFPFWKVDCRGHVKAKNE